MITHAFFKALLFLGAGSVIIGMAHDQDMRHYGNLRKYMPITAGTFIIGWLAIAGVPPFSGFWSKDEILAGAFNFRRGADTVLWVDRAGRRAAHRVLHDPSGVHDVLRRGEVARRWRRRRGRRATRTSRRSERRADADARHAHGDAPRPSRSPTTTPSESSWIMTVPLVVLAGLALVGGLLNLPFSRPVRAARALARARHRARAPSCPSAPALWVLAILAIAHRGRSASSSPSGST